MSTKNMVEIFSDNNGVIKSDRCYYSSICSRRRQLYIGICFFGVVFFGEGRASLAYTCMSTSLGMKRKPGS